MSGNSINFIIECRNLFYEYSPGHAALNNINLNIANNEKIALIGSNGSGKSTLLLNIAGVLNPSKGKINIYGKIGFTFQNSEDQILMPTVIEDVAFSLIASGVNLNSAHEQAHNILKNLGIEHLADRSPHKLSGGEKRLITLAGVLVNEPEILILDEPTSSLDSKARRRIINFLRDYNNAVLMTTHDLDLALEICQRVIILNNGEIKADGNINNILHDKNLLELNGLELPIKFS